MTNPNHEKAAKINESAFAAYKSISGNPDLSDDGKRRQLAAVYVKTKTQLGELRDGAKNADADSMATLRRRAFGMPSDPINAMSYRDALGRAQQLTDKPASMVEELNRALARGDDLQAQAIASIAWDMGFSNIVNAYADANPGVAQTLTDLAQRQNSESAGNSFLDGMHYFAAKPNELDGLRDFQIDELARS